MILGADSQLVNIQQYVTYGAFLVEDTNEVDIGGDRIGVLRVASFLCSSKYLYTLVLPILITSLRNLIVSSVRISLLSLLILTT